MREHGSSLLPCDCKLDSFTMPWSSHLQNEPIGYFSHCSANIHGRNSLGGDGSVSSHSLRRPVIIWPHGAEACDGLFHASWWKRVETEDGMEDVVPNGLLPLYRPCHQFPQHSQERASSGEPCIRHMSLEETFYVQTITAVICCEHAVRYYTYMM